MLFLDLGQLGMGFSLELGQNLSLAPLALRIVLSMLRRRTATT